MYVDARHGLKSMPDTLVHHGGSSLHGTMSSPWKPQKRCIPWEGWWCPYVHMFSLAYLPCFSNAPLVYQPNHHCLFLCLCLVWQTTGLLETGQAGWGPRADITMIGLGGCTAIPYMAALVLSNQRIWGQTHIAHVSECCTIIWCATLLTFYADNLLRSWCPTKCQYFQRLHQCQTDDIHSVLAISKLQRHWRICPQFVTTVQTTARTIKKKKSKGIGHWLVVFALPNAPENKVVALPVAKDVIIAEKDASNIKHGKQMKTK